jgi:hypothetical protein
MSALPLEKPTRMEKVHQHVPTANEFMKKRRHSPYREHRCRFSSFVLLDEKH